MKWTLALLATAVMILMPDAEAWAWGPGVHLAAGNFFLARLDCIAPEIARLLAGNPRAFLYGCLSADIFIGKGCTVRPGHSHNWSIGQGLLLAADTDRTRAYAYGYLAHLAADTVAHNFYVPNMLALTPGGGKISHVYAEMQADRMVQWDHHQAVSLFSQPERDTDQALRTTMAASRLPFMVKKRVMKGHLALCGTREYTRSLDLAQRLSRHKGARSYFQLMFGLTLDAVGDFLTQPEISPVLSQDPVGSQALWQVKQILRKRRRLSRGATPDQPGSLFPVVPAFSSLPDIYSSCPIAALTLRCG
ncbi:MAG: zinc dependent phospholipase C family protein [Proteobacteria bacterium]|nr:zinc dependent phospholipase C family protein [Pseudomonadota bacterium]